MRKEENEMSAAMRAGFTLIEILVAVAIIGILGMVAMTNIPKMLESSKQTAAKSAVDNIANAVTTYSLNYKKMPNDLTDLIKEDGDDGAILEGGEGALEDPWGTTYKLEWKGSGKKRFAIVSAGSDGEFGTDDDIRSDKIKSSKQGN